MSNPKIHTGAKFYRYIEGSIEPEVIRIRNIDYKSEEVKYYDSDGNKKRMKYSKLYSDYRMLSPDAMVSFSIVTMGRDSDVIVALKPMPKTAKDYEEMNNMPYAICRQMVSDFYTNNTTKVDGITYLGVCTSQDTIPASIDFNILLACTELKYNRMVAVYIDDSLEDILSLFDNGIFDKVFDELNKTYGSNPSFRGINNSLKALLESNNFMYDFRKCFKIIEIPFGVDEELEGLDPYNQQFLENELKVNIMETYLIAYSRTINLNKFKRDYVLVSSAQENHSKIYIVGYDKYDGEYVPRNLV